MIMTISIVITAYNVGKYIEKSIKPTCSINPQKRKIKKDNIGA